MLRNKQAPTSFSSQIHQLAEAPHDSWRADTFFFHFLLIAVDSKNHEHICVIYGRQDALPPVVRREPAPEFTLDAPANLKAHQIELANARRRRRRRRRRRKG